MLEFALYLFVNGKEINKFKANNKNVIFPTQFYLGSISNRFGATESRQSSLKEKVYDFSINHNAINKSDILNIYKYLMFKNNIKFKLIKQVFIALLCFTKSLCSSANTSDHVKCISLNNQQRMNQLTLINLHPNEYIEGLRLSICSESTPTPIPTPPHPPPLNLNLSVFNMITGINESKM